MTTKKANLFLLALAMQQHACANDQLSIYQEVRSSYLKTFAQKKQDTTLYHGHSLMDEEPTQKLELVAQQLDNFTQHDLAATMLKEYGTLQAPGHVTDAVFNEKLELTCGNEKADASLLSVLTHNDTSIFGTLGTASILINPSANRISLHGRQQSLKTIINMIQEKAIDKQLTILFNAFKSGEAAYIGYWSPEPAMNKKLARSLYYSKSLDSYNKSPLALELKTRFRNFTTLCHVSLPLILTTAWRTYMEYVESARLNGHYETKEYSGPGYSHISTTWVDGNPISAPTALWRGIAWNKKIFQALDPRKKTFKNLTLKEIHAKFSTDRGVDWGYYDAIKPQTLGDVFHDPGRNIAEIALGAVVAGTVAYNTKAAWNKAQLNTTTTSYLHARIQPIAQGVLAAKKLYTLMLQDSTTAQMPAVQQLGHFFGADKTCSQNLTTLLNILETDTLTSQATFFSLTGRVLAAHALMIETKDELVPLFEAVGHIEAHVAVAKLFVKHQNKPAHFCFAEFLEAAEPSIAMHNFWNPFMNADTVVTNNVQLNNGAQRNAILTGPNTAGKSTIIKAVALNIVLAQTFGICAADSASITPFSKLNCHMNITDNIAKGASLFQAELTQARELVDSIKALQKNQFCFTIMDELFNGTNAEGGTEAAYKFSNILGEYSNLILVVATHFGKLTELEQESNFRNVHVGAYLDENGSLVRPFKLQDGIFYDPKNKILQALLEREGIFLSAASAA